jgi:MFS family permease
VTSRPDAVGDAESAPLSPRDRWRTLVGAGLGWTFDGYETYALVLTLGVSLPQLLPAEDHDRIPFFAGATIALTLFGFGLGGIGGGILADRLGRRRTLLVTVCAYALLTGLTALAWSWWSFAALRLLTGVALGAEWSTGATLVAETWPDRLRSRAVALMQSGLGVGFFAAALVWFVIGPLGPGSWRWMFVVGVVPALFALAFRRRVPASPTWTAQRTDARSVAVSARRRSTARRIMADPALRRLTLLTSVMSLATTLGWWGVSTFIPQYFASVAVPLGWEPSRAASVSGMVYTAGGVLGYLLVGYLAELWGRRPTTALFFAAAFVLTPVVFLWTHTVSLLLVLLFVNGVFTLGQYAWMAVWLPELYPTSVRATGIALVFNGSRFLACFGPLVAGSLIVALGGFGATATTVGCIYLVGLVVVWLLPETRGKPLPQG